jgi:hypothetical protein
MSNAPRYPKRIALKAPRIRPLVLLIRAIDEEKYGAVVE